MKEKPIKTRNIPPYDGNADRLGNVLAFDNKMDAWFMIPADRVRGDPSRFTFWMTLPQPPECDCEDALRNYFAHNKEQCSTSAVERIAARAFNAGWEWKDSVERCKIRRLPSNETPDTKA